MPRTGSTTLELPPFTGATRRIIIINVVVFFTLAILGLVLPTGLYAFLEEHLSFIPRLSAHGEIWQLITYVFLPAGILGTVFTNLTIWFVGPMLEDTYGKQWLYQLYFLSAAGAALLAGALSFTHIFGLDPRSAGSGAGAAILGLLIAIAMRFGDVQFLLLFIIRIKAKYLVAIYVLIDLATLLKESNPFSAALSLAGALCGFLYVRYAPRRGYALIGSVKERYYATQNAFYRNKRRQAAKKFEVYMRKENRDVHFDKDGHYIEQDLPSKDPNDKRWMN